MTYKKCPIIFPKAGMDEMLHYIVGNRTLVLTRLKYVINVSFEFRKAVHTGFILNTDLFYWLIIMNMTLGLLISYRVSVEMLWQ